MTKGSIQNIGRHRDRVTATGEVTTNGTGETNEPNTADRNRGNKGKE
ncbi:MAG: hypothetical protein NT154_08120 [Verrucomicrobia bacterium]|nr:hypothetical protein [Verrucomicrobiota bacterium]